MNQMNKTNYGYCCINTTYAQRNQLLPQTVA